MSERGKAALTALLASINTAVLLWALYSEIVNAIYVAFGYIAIMVLIERIIEAEGKDEMKNEELHGNGYMAAKSDDTAAKHGVVDKLTDGEQTTARGCDNAAKYGHVKEPDIGPKGPEGNHENDIDIVFVVEDAKSHLDVEISAARSFAKLLQKNCTIRHRDGQKEAVISYAKIDELLEDWEDGARLKSIFSKEENEE